MHRTRIDLAASHPLITHILGNPTITRWKHRASRFEMLGIHACLHSSRLLRIDFMLFFDPGYIYRALLV